MYDYISNTTCSIGEKSSTCKTVPFHAVMCYCVLKLFSVRTNWNFFSTDGNGMTYYSVTENRSQN